jgi:diaminopimelate decarboxylase
VAAEDSSVRDLVGLFPPGTHLADDGTLVVGGCRLDDLAAEFGTPAYVVDEGALRARAREFRNELTSRWANSQVVFASKSFPCTAAYRLMAREGLGVDVAGAGELVLALAGGVAGRDIVLHGNAKSDVDLAMAIEAGVGTVVVDNFDDIDRLERLVTGEQGVLVRLIPGISAPTHAAVATGHDGSKFGLSATDARAAVERLRHSDKLRLDGVHVHVGSQILDAEPLARAAQAAAALGDFDVYDLGGGLGVRYTYTEHPPTVADYVGALTDAAREHLPSGARILIEPGRSMVARAGFTLYRVLTVKHGSPTFVAVDGGMGDNLEVSLYDQRFEATVANRVGGGAPVDLVGRHCESGDRLIAGVPLDDPKVGDLVAVPATGAYCMTMANNYNGALRPPVVFCSDGVARAVVRRETYEDLTRRDLS